MACLVHPVYLVSCGYQTDNTSETDPTKVCYMVDCVRSLRARASAIEHEGHRPVVQQLDLHVCGKNPGFYVGSVMS
jgi:hypothetical protein